MTKEDDQPANAGDEARLRIADLDVLKAFGHPLRMRLYRQLYVAGRATASQLADQVDEADSLVSYHLRKLAKHGLIREAEAQSSDARERWWRVAARNLTFSDRDFRGGPEEIEGYASTARLLATQRTEMYLRFLDAQDGWGQQWRTAAFTGEHLPRLTADELAELSEELDQLLQRWTERGRAAEAAGDTEGRENVSIQLTGFPFRS